VLGTTLWLVVAIGLLAATMLDAAAAFGRGGVHAAADHAVEAAMQDAVAEYQAALQTAIVQGALPANPLQRTYPADPNDGSAGARFTVAYEVTPTTLAPPSCSGTADPPSAPDAIGWLQCNRNVAESRASLHVTVRVSDPAGTTLAQRDQYVTLRLFGEPPYSAVVGRKDAGAGDPASADALEVPAHEGDVGGDTLSGSPPVPAASPWPAGGTLIHVRYECHDGAGSCANAAPPDPDADVRAGARWSNGNRPAP
jgi:hypothetical protein